MSIFCAHHLPTGLEVTLNQVYTYSEAKQAMHKIDFYMWKPSDYEPITLTYTYYGRESAVTPLIRWIGNRPEQFDIIER